MTTRLDRLQKLRPLKQPYQNIDLKLPSFPNSTIDSTTNVAPLNPNFKATQHDPLSSRGLDNWSLNNNLKQFSQTRQVGFFKNRRQNQRHKSNPYIIHKVRTPDIRTIDRDQSIKKMDETLGNFKKTDIHSHSTIEQDKVSKLLLENVLAKHQKTNTAKFYPQSKGNTKLQTKKEIEETLPIQLVCKNPMKNTIKSFRKNRFQLALDNPTSLGEEMPQKLNEELADPSQQNFQSANDEQQVQIQTKKSAPRVVSFEMKKRTLNKVIESINRTFLNQADAYFDHFFKNPSPQPQLQLFVNTITQPERARSVNEKSSQSSNLIGQYDFRFEQEKKARRKTPKRKNHFDVPE